MPIRGLQVGGGITDANASEFLEAGASAVIVTSFVFRDGRIDYDCLNRLEQAVGKEHLVLDLSCRYRADAEEPGYYIVTDRWQKFTTERVTNELLEKLSSRCSEFLVHAVDVEGKSGGIEKPWHSFWETGEKFRSPMPEAFTVLKIWKNFQGLGETG